MPTTLNDVRFSYCNLFQAKPPANNPNGEAKYSTTVLVPKTNAAAKAAIDAAIREAIQAGVSKSWGGVQPPTPALPIHDGDGPRPSDGMPYGEECRGCWVFTASSKQPPFVVDANVQNIMDPRAVYSGMWGNISVNFFAYNQAGKKGIGCGLNGVQKTRDGEPLSGGITAEEAFKPAAATPAYGQPATPAYGGAMPATPAYSQQPAPTPAPAPGYGQPATPGYGQPVAPAYAPPAYSQQPAPTPAPAYGAPGYGQPAVDPITGQPITGQPMAPQGYNPTGAPIMGL